MRTTNRLFTSGLYTAVALSFAAYSTAVFALTELENIRVSPLSGDQLELQFDFNEPVTSYTVDRHRGRQLAAPLPHHLACGSAPGGSRS